jgi:cytochrome P450
MWAATHSVRNFHDPYSFRPERWLPRGEKEDEDADPLTTDKLDASNAFSLGPRGCIGRKYVSLFHSVSIILFLAAHVLR